MDSSLAIMGKATLTADPINGVRNELRVVANRRIYSCLLSVMKSRLIPFLNQSAIFVGGVVGFLNVCTVRVCIPQGGIIKTDHFLTGELRYCGVTHIRFVASSLPPRYHL
jgi:hypothetical protein